jgi:hypothetical protein
LFCSFEKTTWPGTVLPVGLSHVFQNLLVEERDDLIVASQSVWAALIDKTSAIDLTATLQARMAAWTALVTAEAGVPLPEAHTVSSKRLVHKPRLSLIYTHLYLLCIHKQKMVCR